MSFDQVESFVTADGRTIGGTVMEMKNISLRFGGVKAITDINVINGFYHPQEGEIWFRGAKRAPMKPHEIAYQGIARTFQNIALFKGMSTLDNIMTGVCHMVSKRGLSWGGP